MTHQTPALISLMRASRKEVDPVGLAPSRDPQDRDVVDIVEITLKGNWIRVFPTNAREILFLQMVEHQQDKFAPARGEGVLLRSEVLQR